MRARAIDAMGDARAIAFALGLGIVALGTALAQAGTPALPAQPRAASASTIEALPALGFVCHAKIDGWCDLHEWSGMPQIAVEPDAAYTAGGTFQ